LLGMKKKTAVAKKPARAKPSANGKARKRAGRMEGPSGERLESILKEVAGTEPSGEKRLEHFGAVQCPYCGESFEIHIEAAEDGQSMYEDCHVCCKPISIHVHVEDDQVEISAYRA
jgi:hypothetical protein